MRRRQARSLFEKSRFISRLDVSRKRVVILDKQAYQGGFGMLFRASVQLLMVGAITSLALSAADSPLAGTWKADLSKTSPADSNFSAATLTIKEIGVRTYNIRIDRQTTDQGVVSEEKTISCDGKSRPVGMLANPAEFADEASPGARVATVLCPRLYPTVLSIRVTQDDGMLVEHVFHAADRNTLKYTKTVYGHDQVYIFGRQ
jgi:hypothetical protein